MRSAFQPDASMRSAFLPDASMKSVFPPQPSRRVLFPPDASMRSVYPPQPPVESSTEIPYSSDSNREESSDFSVASRSTRTSFGQRSLSSSSPPDSQHGGTMDDSSSVHPHSEYSERRTSSGISVSSRSTRSSFGQRSLSSSSLPDLAETSDDYTWSRSTRSSFDERSLSSSTTSAATVIPNPFRSLREHNRRLQQLEREMADSHTTPVYGDVRAHSLSPSPVAGGVPECFKSQDSTPPSFVPLDPSSLSPNITRDWGHPMPIAEPEFEGETVFSKRPIASQLVPDTTRFEEIVSPAARSRAEAVFPEQYFADRQPVTYASSSSASSAESVDSQIMAPPLPPRVANRSLLPRPDFELRPARFAQPEQKPGVLNYFKQKIQEEANKELQRRAEKKAKKKGRDKS